jgi:iron complex outermembrane recepter protein
MMRFKLSKLARQLPLPLTIGLLASSLPAIAQENNNSSNKKEQAGLEVISVTAQKRVENVQEVPITISAVSADSIRDNDISNVTEISAFIPNVEMDATSPFAGSSSVLSAFIRGIGQNDFAFNLEPGVGLYVDGVYYARTIGAVVDTLNLERIEVLKGPQGTLFGRNTIGGAISITTRAPDEDFNFQTETTLGSFNRQDIRVSADVPLSDNLFSQFSFSSKRRDGYQKRIHFAGAEQFINDVGKFNTVENQASYGNQSGAENGTNARLKLLYRASADIDITWTSDMSHTNESAAPSSLIAVNSDGSLASLYNTCIGLDVATLEQIGLGAACGVRGVVGTSFAGANVDDNPNNNRLPIDERYITGDPDTTYATGSNFSILDAWGTALTVDWSLGDSIDFKSITSFRKLEASFGVDNSGAPLILVDTSFYTEQKQYSQELQLTGKAFDDKLDWVTGLYYFKEEGMLLDTPIFAAGLVQVYGPNFLENKAVAAFAHLNYAVTEEFGLTFGLRYTEENKQFEGQQQELNGFGIKVGFPSFLYPDQTDLTRVFPLGVNKLDFNDTSVHMGAQYKLSSNIMTYYSYSEGFKSGGWTTRLTLPEPGNVVPTFEPEEATSHELGIKSRFWDNRAQINAAMFHTDYENIQVTVSRGLSPFFENAAAGVIKGLEFEGQFLVTDDLFVNLALGYIDAAYTELNEGTAIEKTDLFVNTPKNSATLGLRYNIPLTSGAEWVILADWAYRSEIANNSENVAGTNQPAASTANASLKYLSDDGKWDVTLRGDNLTDKRLIVSGFENADVGTTQVVYSAPRQWSLTLGYQF